MANSRNNRIGKGAGQRNRRAFVVGGSALASLCLLCAAFALGGLAPFGGLSLAGGQSAEATLALLAQTKQSFFYNIYTAAGAGNLGLLAGALPGPFGLLLLAVPAGLLPAAYNLTVLLQVAGAAAAAALLFTSEDAPFKAGRALGGVLGVLYAFGGASLFFAAPGAALFLLWLAPLFTLALLRLAKRGKCTGFTLALAALLFFAPRQALTAVPFLVLLAAVYLLFFANKQTGLLLALRLAGGSGTALLLSAPGWLPYLLQLGAAAPHGTLPEQFAGLTLFGGLAGRAIPVLCGGAAIVAVVLAVWARLWRQRAARFVLLAFCLSLLAVALSPLATLWGWLAGGMGGWVYLPVWLGTLLLSAGVEVLYRRPGAKQPAKLSAALVAFDVLVYLGILAYLLFGKQAGGAQAALYGGGRVWALFAAFVGAVVLFGIAALRGGLDISRRVFAFAFAALVAAQAVYGLLAYTVPDATVGTGAQPLAALATKTGLDGRVKAASATSATGSAGAFWPGIASGGALTRGDTLTALKKLGYSGYGAELSGYGGTLISDAFLNIDATLAYTESTESGGYSVADAASAKSGAALAQAGGWALVQAPVRGSWGWVVQADIDSITTVPEGDRLAAQSWLAALLWNTCEGIVTRYGATTSEAVRYEQNDNTLDQYGVWQATEGAEGKLAYILPVGERETLYFDCARFISSSLDEVVNDGLAITVNGAVQEWPYPTRQSNGILCLGTYEYETVEITVELLRSELVRSFGVAGIRESALAAAAENTAAPEIAVAANGAIQASVAAEEGDWLLLPVAYDEGFTATVNGQKADVYQVLDGFMAVGLAAGQNTVSLTYTPRGLLPCAALMLLGVAALLLQRRKGAGLQANTPGAGALSLGLAGRLLFLALGAAAALLLYLLPLVLWLQAGALFPAG